MLNIRIYKKETVEEENFTNKKEKKQNMEIGTNSRKQRKKAKTILKRGRICILMYKTMDYKLMYIPK